MDNCFSERNDLVVYIEDNKYNENFRRSIVTSFINVFSGFEVGNSVYHLNNLMDIFGIPETITGYSLPELKENTKTTIQYFLTCPWYELFDFVEYALAELKSEKAKELSDKYNTIFRRFGCRFRVVCGKVIPITDEVEIKEISEASNIGIKAVATAYNEAITLLSEKSDPDYNAVVAKASNALESMILSIAEDNSVQDNTLGKALKKLEEKGIATDEDLNALIRKIYDYACNAGIRHDGTEPVTATEDEAIFVLVTCAATINYINMKYYGTH